MTSDHCKVAVLPATPCLCLPVLLLMSFLISLHSVRCTKLHTFKYPTVLQMPLLPPAAPSGFMVAEWDLERRGMGHIFGSGTKQHGRLDVSGLTVGVIEEVGAPAAGVAMVEAARRAAVVVAREWEDEQAKHENAENGVEMEVALKAIAAFRPQPLTAADALVL